MADNGKPRLTCAFAVDFDAASIWHAFGAHGARTRSRGNFARVAVPRILDLLDKYEAPSTWFMPGHSAETHPDLAAEVAKRGHEIGNHGYIHEDFTGISQDAVREILVKSQDALEKVTGQRPRGIRIPVGDFEEDTFELLIEEGFTYDSSLLGGGEDEYSPYWARAKGEVPLTGPTIEGPQINLVEIPLCFHISDFYYMEFNYGAPFLPGNSEPDKVYRIWEAEFNYAYEEMQGGYFHFTVHPQAIGRGGRFRNILERFFAECISRDGVKVVTFEQIADDFRKSQGGAPPAA